MILRAVKDDSVLIIFCSLSQLWIVLGGKNSAVMLIFRLKQNVSIPLHLIDSVNCRRGHNFRA